MDNSLVVIFFASFLFSLAPIFLLSFTCFLKIQIVLSIFKNSLGVQGVPSALITMLLSLALSFLIMEPITQKSLDTLSEISFDDFQNLEIGEQVGLVQEVLLPWVSFIKKHTSEEDSRFVLSLVRANQENLGLEKKSRFLLSDYSRTLLAFLITEIKEAFEIGLLIIIPLSLIHI